MATNHSLLSYVLSQQYIPSSENAATDALCFMLSHSDVARGALSDFLADGSNLSPIAKANTRTFGKGRSIPDLACLDDAGKVVVLIESKFWAGLSVHQPVTYWERLPTDRPSVLLFLAPDYSVGRGSLWEELVARLQKSGYELNSARMENGVRSATAKDDQRRLMLAGWETFLDRFAEKTMTDPRGQTLFEIAELRGLADSIIRNNNPGRYENLTKLIKLAVDRLKVLGWANTEGLTVGHGAGYYARYLRLAGAPAGLLIDDSRDTERTPYKPLWLSFYRGGGEVPRDKVRILLQDISEPFSIWEREDVSVPIELPDGADQEEVLNAMVERLVHIGSLIDPDGPTYKKDSRDA